MIHIRWAVLILVLAGCTPAPVVCPVCPPPKPQPETARYEPRGFTDLPGWNRAQLEPSLRAFIAGCARFKRVCALAKSLPAGDEQAARRFFETEFVPYALISSESGDTGLVTGYYEPIVDGSRVPSAQHRFPIFGVPPDLVIVDLGNVVPETRPLRLRGRLEGRRLVPYYSRAEIDGRGEAFGAPVLAWSGDPVELGIAKTLGRPGGRFTGVSMLAYDLVGKRVELLHEILSFCDGEGLPEEEQAPPPSFCG